ncbi:MAG TPA: nuclear transport factor 2 family protein [Solirubrobacteraceae bacterium]|nr:nuclear transport factor 2 family protein [Solirubrobacteraceae bacterium]
MSEESTTSSPIEQTRRAYRYLNSGDFDALTGMFGASSVWDVSRWGLGVHRGVKGIRTFLDDWFGSLAEYQVEIEEIRDLGNGVVFVVVEQTAYRPASRGPLRVRSAPVFVWTDNAITQVTVYPNFDEGRAAAGRLAESRG